MISAQFLIYFALITIALFRSIPYLMYSFIMNNLSNLSIFMKNLIQVCLILPSPIEPNSISFFEKCMLSLSGGLTLISFDFISLKYDLQHIPDLI